MLQMRHRDCGKTTGGKTLCTFLISGIKKNSSEQTKGCADLIARGCP